MFINLSNQAKIVKAANGTGAAQTALLTANVNANGFDSVLWIVDLGAVTDSAVMTLTAYNGNATSQSIITAPNGVNVATSPFTGNVSSNGTIMLDVQRPGSGGNDYVSANFTRTAQNVTVNSIYAILYNARQAPTTQPSTCLAYANFLAAT